MAASTTSTALIKKRSIFDAIKDASVVEMESLVRQGTDINAAADSTDADKNKFTPLQFAANAGQLECLQWLLWYGADHSPANPRGWTAAHLAAIRGHDACLQALINNGAALHVRDSRGCTPAHLSATHGHAFTLSAILRTGADANANDKNGWTPVHYATYHGRLGCLQLLVRWGGRVDEVDVNGNTAFHLAGMEGQLSCLKFLVSSAATKSVADSLSARNDHGETPKMLAQQFYKENVVTYISGLEYERDHPDDGPDSLAFPAHVAAYGGDLNHLQALIEQGVVNINERNGRGNTPLHRSAGQGHLHCVKWLVEAGADCGLTNASGETALDLARRFAHLGVIELLSVAMGIDDDDDDNDDNQTGNDDKRKAREWARRHGHGTPSALSTRSGTSSSAHARKEAKARAMDKLKETARMLDISKKNFLQLGGDLAEMGNLYEDSSGAKKVDSPEEIDAKKANKLVAELEAALEYERVRREKLEAQLDACRDGMERLNSSKSFPSGDGNDDDSSDGGETLRTATGRSSVASSSRHRNGGLKSSSAKSTSRKSKPASKRL